MAPHHIIQPIMPKITYTEFLICIYALLRKSTKIIRHALALKNSVE